MVGIVEEVYVTGTIQIGDKARAIGGINGDYGRVNNCYSNVNIIGEGNNTVKIAGIGNGVISNSYAIGQISVENGVVDGIKGSTGYITNSYWSTEKVGISKENSVNPDYAIEDINEMTHKSMYENWDFDSVWRIDEEGKSLPVLRVFDKNEVTKLEAGTPVTTAITEENLVDHIGEYINLGTDITNLDETGHKADWRIFDVDETGVYAILSDYLPTANMPDTMKVSEEAGAKEVAINKNENGWTIGWTKGDGANQCTDNTEAVGTLLTASNWNYLVPATSPLRGHITGSPTYQQFANGWDNKYGETMNRTIPTPYSSLEDSTGMFIITDTKSDTIFGNWLASANTGNVSNMWGVSHEGFVNSGSFCDDSGGGLRPIVHLTSNIHLEGQDEEGVWQIESKGLEGAEIGIYDEDHNPVTNELGNNKVIVTDSNGKAKLSIVGLEPGTYYYKEEKAPLGYLKDDDSFYSFSLSETGEITLDNANGLLYNSKLIVQPGQASATLTKYRTGTTPGTSIINEITESNVASHIGEYINIGTYITNLDETGHKADWRIFDADENGVYAILSDYLPTDSMPDTMRVSEETGAKEVAINKNENGWTMGWLTEGEGAVDNNTEAVGTLTTASNWDFLVMRSFTMEGSPFKGHITGGPTYEQFANSWNKKYGANQEINVATQTQYTGLEDSTGLYMITDTKNDQIYANWLASTSNEYENCVLNEGSSNGIVSFYILDDNEKFGIRPLIYIPANILVTGQDADGVWQMDTKGLPGAKVELYAEDKTTKLDEFTTNQNGQIDFASTGKLEALGTYYYKETQAPYGYELDDSWKEITVDGMGVVALTEGNSLFNDKIIAQAGQEGSILTKLETETTTALPGAKIELYASDKTTKLDEFITDENGQIDFASTGKLEACEMYYYKEVEAPAGYVLDDSWKEIVVDGTGIVTLLEGNTLYNDKITAPAGQEGSIITKYETGTDKIATHIGESINIGTNILNLEEDGRTSDWEIFYEDETGVYAMLSSYLPTRVMPDTMKVSDSPDSKEISIIKHTDYTIGWLDNGEGSATNEEIAEALINPSNWDFLLPEDSPYKGHIVGASTYQQFAKSWNKANREYTEMNETTPTAYSNLSYGWPDIFYTYIQENGLWLATADSNNPDKLWSINVNNYSIEENGCYTEQQIGIRPIIHLPADTIGIQNDNYEWEVKPDKKGLSGAKIELYAEDKETKLDEFTTDENGQIDLASTGKLKAGETYYYKETEAPRLYDVDNSWKEITVDLTGIVTLTEGNVLYNDKKSAPEGQESATITVQKRVNGQIKDETVSDVWVELYAEDKITSLDWLVTDANGKIDLASTGQLKVLKTYYYKIEYVPEGYSADDDWREIVVDEEGNVTLTEGNVLYIDKIIASVGQTGSILTKYRTGTTVGMPITSQITEENIAEHIGEYIDLGTNITNLDETGHNADWRIFDADETGVYAILSDYLPNTILPDTMKVSEEEGAKEVAIVKADNGLTIGWSNRGEGAVANNTEAVSTLTTASNWNFLAPSSEFNGEITGTPTYEQFVKSWNKKYSETQPIYTTTVSINLTDSTEIYKITDSNSDTIKGYWLASTFPGNSNLKIVSTMSDSGTITTSIYNALRPIVHITSNIKTTGQNEDGVWQIGYEKLPGAKIELYAEDKETKLDEFITDENGQIDFASTGKLEAGETYYFKEVEAPTGYVITDDSWKEITVDATGEVTLTEGNSLFNDKIIAQVGQIDSILTKYANGTTPGTSIASEITGENVSSHIGEYINLGTNITNLDATGHKADWRIFDADETGVYAILSDHLPTENMPDTMKVSDAEDAEEIAIVKNGWRISWSIGCEGQESIKTSGTLTTSSNWNFLVPESSPLVGHITGGPTYQQFAKSWNKVNSSVKIINETTPTEYSGLNDTTGVYCIEAGSYSGDMWLATPSVTDYGWNFYITDQGYISYTSSSSSGRFVRPIVHLTPEIFVTGQDADGVWQMDQKGLSGAKIELYSSDKETKLDEFITNSNGKIDLASTGKLEACETYYYKEVEAPTGYVLDDSWKEIVVDETGAVTLTEGNNIYNSKIVAQAGQVGSILTKYRTGTTPGTSITNEITEENVASHIGEYIDLGTNITNLRQTGHKADWRIFDADETGVYAMLSDYLPTANIPDTMKVSDAEDAREVTIKKNDYDNTKYTIHWEKEGEGAATTSDALGTLTTESNWNFMVPEDSPLKGHITGAPTYEQFAKSWNKVNGETAHMDEEPTEWQFDLTDSTGMYYTSSSSYDKKYYIATEYQGWTNSIWCVGNGNAKKAGETGYTNRGIAMHMNIYTDLYPGRVRPIVHLTPEILVTGQNSDGVWQMDTNGLPGAKIELYASDKTTKLDEFTTDAYGKIDFASTGKLEVLETYYYKEIEAPEGYTITDDSWREITVDAEGNVILSQGNSLFNDKIIAQEGQAGSILTKYRTGTTTALPNAKIELYASDKTTKLDEFITNENGRIDFASTGKLEALETYYYKEVEAPTGYVLDDSWKEIVVDATGAVTLTEGNELYNSKIKAPLGQASATLTKYRTGTTDVLPGAKVELYAEDKTTKLDEFTTDENGQIDFASTGKLEVSETYYYKEVKAPKGYRITDDSWREIVVDEEGKVTLTEGNSLFNEKVIVPIGQESAILTKYETGKTDVVLPGAKIELYASDKETKIDEFITDSNGQINFTRGLKRELKEGDWVNYDTGVEGVGVIPCIVLYNDDEHGLQLISAGVVGTVTLGGDDLETAVKNYNEAIVLLNNAAEAYINPTYVYDARCVGSVPTVGTNGMFTEKNNENENLTALGGTSGIKGTDSNYQTDWSRLDNGNTFDLGNLSVGNQYGSYWLASRSYSTNLSAYSIREKSVDSWGRPSTYNHGIIFVGGDGPRGYKTESNLRPCFSLKSNLVITGGTGTNLENAYTLGTIGKLEACETYYYKEVKAPKGYRITDDSWRELVVDEEGIVTLTEGNSLFNDNIMAPAGQESATLTLYRTGTTQALPWAEFELYAEDKTTELDYFYTNENGKIDLASTGELEFSNTYYYKEVDPPYGYVLDDSWRKIVVDEEGNVTLPEGNILYNDKIIAQAGQESGILTKYRAGTTEVLQGAKIEVYAEDKTTKLDEFTTDENGQIDFASTGKLEADEKYYYKEVEAPEGYIITDDSWREISVDEWGEITLPEGNRLYNYKIIAPTNQESATLTKYRTGTTETLSGVKIELYAEDKTTKLDEFITDSNGQINFTRESNVNIKEQLKEGDWVLYDTLNPIYGTNGVVPCRVLYNDEEHGLQIISESYVGWAGFGRWSSAQTNEELKEQYCNAVRTLNDNVKRSTNLLYVYDARCVGSVATVGENGLFNAKNSIVEGPATLEFSYNGSNQLDVPDKDTNYEEDWNQMENLGENNEDIRFSLDYYWLASNNIRYYEGGGHCYIGVRRVCQGYLDSIDNIQYSAGYGLSSGSYNSNGIRACFSLKPDIIITGGTGEDEENAYTLGTTDKLEACETYYYKEVEAPTGYVLDDSWKEITVDETGAVTLTEGNSLYNSKIVAPAGQTSATLTKYRTDTTQTLTGAKIELYAENKTTKLDEFTTDENGQIDFASTGKLEALETYYYKETEAPAGYTITDNSWREITVDETGAVTLTQGNSLYNDIIIAPAGQTTATLTKLKKVNGQATDTVVPDAVIGVYKSDKTTKIEELTTNANGQVDFGASGKLEALTTYYYKEEQAPTGYIADTTWKEIVVNATGTITLTQGNTLYNEKVVTIAGQEGSILTKLKRVNGQATNIAVPGAVIGVYAEDKTTKIEELTTNSAGQVDFGASGKLEALTVYYYKEEQAPAGYTITDTSWKRIVVDETGAITLTQGNTLYNDKIMAPANQESGTLTKLKRVNGQATNVAVPGAVIGVYEQDKTTKIEELTTNANGQVDFGASGKLEALAIYYYKEEQAPAGYTISDTSWKRIVVNETGEISLTQGNILYNDRIMALANQTTAVLTKLKRIGGQATDVVVPGAVIGVYESNQTTKIEELTTNSNGQVDFSASGKLEAGETYYYKEEQAPAGYTITDNGFKEIAVSVSGVITLTQGSTLYNDRITANPGSIVITKVNEKTNEAIPNTEIGLCDVNGNIFKNSENEDVKYLTDENGQIDFTTKILLEPGTYYFREVTATTGYVLDETPHLFIVNNDGTVTFTGVNGNILENSKITTIAGQESSILTKLKRVNGLATDIVVPGTVIGVYAEDKTTKIEELTTDANGQVDFGASGKLEALTTYYYKEEQAPAGYIADTNWKEIVVNATGAITLTEGRMLYNDKITASEGQEGAIVTKIKKLGGQATNVIVPGAVIGVYAEDKTTKVEELTTDENGQIDLGKNNKLEACETYYYKEEQAPAGYIADNAWKEIVVNETGEISLTEGNIIYNERVIAQTGNAVITKINKITNETLPGAEIGLCDENGNILMNSENVEAKYLTDANGQLDFATKVYLEPGTYYFKETSAPTGYLLDETIHSFTVSDDGTVTFNEENGNILKNMKLDDILYLKSTEYLICDKQMTWTKGTQTEYKNGDKYISKVTDMTSLSKFIQKLDTNGIVKVTKTDGTVLKSNEYVGTGMTLIITKDEQKIELTIIVIGDVSGDGLIEIDDFASIKNAYWAEATANTPDLMAVDFDDNGVILMDDYATEKIMLYMRM